MDSGEHPGPAKKGRGTHPNSLANLHPASRFTPGNAREFAQRSHAARCENELRGERPTKRQSRMPRIFAKAEKIVEDALQGRPVSPQRLNTALAVLKLRGLEPTEQAVPLRVVYARPRWAPGVEEGAPEGDTGNAEESAHYVPPRTIRRKPPPIETGSGGPPLRGEPAPARQSPVCEAPAGQVDGGILAYVKGRPRAYPPFDP